MPRLRRVSGLYKTCRHLWEACGCPWYARYRKVQGMSLARWYGVPCFQSKDEVLRALNEFKHQIDGGTFNRRGRNPTLVEARSVQEEPLRFGDFLDRYRHGHVYLKEHRSTSTHAVLGVFGVAFGSHALRQLASEPDVIEKWLHDRRRQRSWSPTTFNRYHEAGRAMFNWARRKGLVRDNPFESIERLDRRRNRRRTEITVEQERALIETLARLPSRQANEMRGRLFAALDCGLRAGEMLRIRRRHVRYGKPEEVWVIDLPATITKASEDQVVYAGTERLKAELQKRRFLDEDGYVFGTEEGRFVGSFDKSWQRLFREAGLPVGRSRGLVWHDLRHEYGIRVAERTDNVADIQEMMRHADIRTSARYLKARERRLKELAAKLGSRVS